MGAEPKTWRERKEEEDRGRCRRKKKGLMRVEAEETDGEKIQSEGGRGLVR